MSRRLIWGISVLMLVACSETRQEEGTPSQAPIVASTATASPTPDVPQPSIAASQEITSANLGSLRAAVSAAFDSPQSLTWRSGSEAVYIASRSRVWFLDSQTGERTDLLSVVEPELILAVSSKGQAAITRDTQTLIIKDSANQGPERALDPGAPFVAATFSPDGALLAVALAGRPRVQLWDLERGVKLPNDLTGFETTSPNYRVRFGSDGLNLIWLSSQTLQIENLVAGKLGPLIAARTEIGAVALDTPGNGLATFSEGLLVLWDKDTGKPLQTLKQSQAIYDLDFSPTGGVLAAATSEGVSFFQMPLATPVASIANPSQQVKFSPSGKSIVTLDARGVVTIWQP